MEHRNDLFSHVYGCACLGFGSGCCQVWGYYNLIAPKEDAILCGLLRKDIDSCTCCCPSLDSIIKRLLIDNASSGTINNTYSWLYHLKFLGAN